MNLYKVYVSFDMVVLAKSKGAAMDIADSHAREELADAMGAIDHVEVIHRLEEVPPEWRDSLPYTARADKETDEHTVEQWLEIFKAEEEERARKYAHRKEPYLPGMEPTE